MGQANGVADHKGWRRAPVEGNYDLFRGTATQGRVAIFSGGNALKV